MWERERRSEKLEGARAPAALSKKAGAESAAHLSFFALSKFKVPRIRKL